MDSATGVWVDPYTLSLIAWMSEGYSRWPPAVYFNNHYVFKGNPHMGRHLWMLMSEARPARPCSQHYSCCSISQLARHPLQNVLNSLHIVDGYLSDSYSGIHYESYDPLFLRGIYSSPGRALCNNPEQ